MDDLFKNIEFKNIKYYDKLHKTCSSCEFYIKNNCTDNDVFVDKKNTKDIVCRYNVDAIAFNKKY